MNRTRATALAFLAALALPGAAQAASAQPQLGIADEQPAMFSDPRFAALHVGQARLMIPWDVLQDTRTLQRVDGWLAGAKAAHVAPLITVDHSHLPGRSKLTPTPRQLTTAVSA